MRIIVVGAGIVGASAAFHLTQFGADGLLLRKSASDGEGAFGISTKCSILSILARFRAEFSFCDRRRSLTPAFSFLAFLCAGVSQHVAEFFRLCRLCRYPGAAGEL